MYCTVDSTRNVTDFREGESEEGMMGETGRTQVSLCDPMESACMISGIARNPKRSVRMLGSSSERRAAFLKPRDAAGGGTAGNFYLVSNPVCTVYLTSASSHQPRASTVYHTTRL